MFNIVRTDLRAWSIVFITSVGLAWSAAAPAGGLTDLLVGKLGVSEPQAVGGAGSIFQLAKNQMTSTNFATLSSAVPDMSHYLAAAPALGTTAPTPGAAALASAAAKALGGNGARGGGTPVGGEVSALGSKLATVQQLAPAFEQLGMKQKLVGKFVPVIVDYVQQQGGASTAQLLRGALGF